MSGKCNIFYALMFSALLLGCNGEDIHKGRIPVASIDGSCLYKDEVDLMYAMYGHGVDSVRFMDDYIERWATEHLFYNKNT